MKFGDQVILNKDIVEEKLSKGQRGTIVHLYANGLMCEIEITEGESKVVTISVDSLNSVK